VSRTSQFPARVRSTAMPTSSATAPVAATTSHAPTPVTGMAAPAASKTAKASARVTTEPTPVSPTPSVRPSVTQTHRPTADILSPVSGMPRWLEDVLLAAGLLAATAFAAEPVVVLAQRRRQRGDQSTERRK
jgi:hypothetical protein